VIVINPPGALGPVQAAPLEGAGLPLERLRASDDGHPVLYGVATDRVALTQTAVVEAHGPLDSLWIGTAGPVLLAGEVGGQRVVVMAFSPQHSEQLPFLPTLPLLIGNAIYWSAQQSIEESLGQNRKTGELVELAGSELTWRAAEDAHAAEATGPPEVTVPIEGRWTQLDRLGLWETDEGQSGSASLLSTADTLLPDRGEIEQGVPAASAAATLLRGDLTPLLLWAIFGVFLLESWLFHRYLAY
jgi:hypothetical protein